MSAVVQPVKSDNGQTDPEAEKQVSAVNIWGRKYTSKKVLTMEGWNKKVITMGG